MLLLYFVFRFRFRHRDDYDFAENLPRCFSSSAFARRCLPRNPFFSVLTTFCLTKASPEWKFRNNYSTFLMICMPAPLMFAKRHRYPIFLSFIMFAVMSLLGSRSGLFLGAIEFCCCLLFLIVTDSENRNLYIIVSLACAAAPLFSWAERL